VKLISRFKDYYDALRAHDMDPTPIYVRVTRHYELDDWHNPCPREVRDAVNPLWTAATLPPSYAPPLPRRRADEQPVGFSRGVVGFCGRTYAFIVLDGRVIFDFAPFRTSSGDEQQRRLVWRAGGYVEERTWRNVNGPIRQDVGDDAFRALDAPVLLMTDRRIVVNPRLNEWEFASQVDPYTAWQELSMYLGNNLVKNTNEPRPITDELKAEAHGFDRQSFRKAKVGRAKLDRGEW
jgi:hypothetical protein